MKPLKDVYIAGYGVYIPVYRVMDAEIARVWGRDKTRTPIKSKSVKNLDEDVVTMSVNAAHYALKRAEIKSSKIGAIFVGSESKPYAVKPTATIVAEAIGATPSLLAVDMEFACRAGTTALQCIMGLVGSEMIEYGMAIGADTSQGRPGDELEYTVGCGAAAYIVGGEENNSVARIIASASYVTDTPDFWRREGQFYPSHAQRFTGEPAYFKHIYEASKYLLEELGMKPSDFDYVVFHQPNIKFPKRVAKKLGFTDEQLKPGLVVNEIGNTYAASTLLGLSAILDIAKPGQKIFLASFGSGAGSDAFALEVTPGIEKKRRLAPLLSEQTKKTITIDYALYVKFRGKLRLK